LQLLNATFDPALQLSPRPAKSFFIVRSPAPVSTLKIFDPTGRSVRKETFAPRFQTAAIKINLSGFSSGIYFVEVETAAGKFRGKILAIK